MSMMILWICCDIDWLERSVDYKIRKYTVNNIPLRSKLSHTFHAQGQSCTLQKNFSSNTQIIHS